LHDESKAKKVILSPGGACLGGLECPEFQSLEIRVEVPVAKKRFIDDK
jgi:hypothetical protein